MVKVITFLFSVTFSVYSLALSQVTASVDKNPVIANESFVLTITADDDIDTNALDTSPLGRDFIVGRTSVSSQTSMVNFKTTRTTRWNIVLIARTPGNVTIPALSIENQQTLPIALQVIAASDASANQQQDLFITSDISAKEVYVQQQLTLTVKLHFAAELKRGSLTEPDLPGANIRQIGKDKESETIVNGRRYRVIERTYAISPQQSGDYVLKSPIFSGEIMVPSSRRNSFLSFAETKPVSVIGDEIPINVKAIPQGYQGTWLPSELLTVHQEWQPKPDEFKVGDPITRVITLTAAGLSEEQLPEINMTLPAGLKVYPDQAQLHTGLNNNRLVSQKVRNFAVVANKAGTYQLPEIVIPWWNTVTNRYQEATIPAQTIVVLPNAEQAPEPQVTESQPPRLDNAPEPEVIVKTESSWLQWLFLALWLMTSVAWFVTTRKSQPKKPQHTLDNESDQYSALISACNNNDGSMTLSRLLPWVSKICGQSITNIAQLQQLSGIDDLLQAIAHLQATQYSKTPEQWQGQAFAKAVKRIQKQGINPPSRPHININP